MNLRRSAQIHVVLGGAILAIAMIRWFSTIPFPIFAIVAGPLLTGTAIVLIATSMKGANPVLRSVICAGAGGIVDILTLAPMFVDNDPLWVTAAALITATPFIALATGLLYGALLPTALRDGHYGASSGTG